MTITPTTALTQLRQHPRTFLEDNLVTVSQFPGASRIVNNVVFQTMGPPYGPLGQRYGTVLGSHNLKPAQMFSFVTNVAGGHASVQVNVQYIQMYPFSSVAGIQWCQPKVEMSPDPPK